MSTPKHGEIYPSYEFRISHRDKGWLIRELKDLREKFNEGDCPAVTNGQILAAALRHGMRYLKQRRKLCEREKRIKRDAIR